MKIMKNIIGLFIITNMLFSCSSNSDLADGYGNFEAIETIISAESNGKLMHFDINEGQVIQKGTNIGYIDTIPLSLKKKQLRASKKVIASKSKGVLSQISVLKSQLKTANVSKNRIQNLIKENAGTQKQLDDINGKIDMINQQIISVESQNAPIINELKSLDIQLLQLDDQIQKSVITNPVTGTVLVKYAEPFEVTAFGKPLYKIADVSTMQLRVYISETQLSSVKTGQEVTIKIDEGDSMKSLTGTVTWIASEAEFTPKIIQTKEERINLVYAVKIDVKNDGSLKIGMPGEMWIENSSM